jgi:osmoprotectant transport system permease protein
VPGAELVAASPFISWAGTWVSANVATIAEDLGQHAELAAIAIGAGLVISVPLGLLAWRFHYTRVVILSLAGLLYTIPSISLFLLIQPLTGYFSILTAEVALTGYTLLILVRNLLNGLDTIPDEVREAAQATGYSPRAQLVRIYLPLALPSLFAGLRVASVTVIGLVTITAFIGFGGLGKLIILGFNDFFYTPVVVGLALSILLAALVDAAFVLTERSVVRWRRTA